MALLNTSLSTHLRAIGIKNDGKGRFLFMPDKTTGGDRVWTLPGGQKRSVAAKKISADGRSAFWVHHGATLNFKRVGNNLFIAVEPHYLFTMDGTVSVEGKNAGKLATIWGGKQQNPDILRNVLFWGYVLAKNQREISLRTGADPIVASRVPASAQLDVGIAFDEVRIGTLFDHDDKELDIAAANAEYVGEETEDDGEEKALE
jgi:hypothetical protein